MSQNSTIIANIYTIFHRHERQYKVLNYYEKPT